jgi:hypothetical protein
MNKIKLTLFTTGLVMFTLNVINFVIQLIKITM